MKDLALLASEGKINKSASMRDRQAIVINAPIEKVWAILVDINHWTDWNPSIKDCKLKELKVGAHFTWNINGNHLKSTLRQIDKPNALTWTGSFISVKAIHAWKLESADNYQTIVTTEESIQGLMTVFVSHPKLNKTLINWLDCLKKQAEK